MAMMKCKFCGENNEAKRYFCSKCGKVLAYSGIKNDKLLNRIELKTARIAENIPMVPHTKIIWNDMIDLYMSKVEKMLAVYDIVDFDDIRQDSLTKKFDAFLDRCTTADFQIAFVGTIKTGKSTLINALLGRNYASMAVSPETAALTKFRSSDEDYVKVIFYSKEEWEELWDSCTSSADTFLREYNELNGDAHRDKWVGHDVYFRKLHNTEIEKELVIWSSSKHPEHYFVKEIEVGISSLPKDFPKQVVFVDTPGLSDPVVYRSNITRNYIRRANAVFVCVDAQKLQQEEVETISAVFSFSAHNKQKVHIIATHWDKLNNPEEDWAEQKDWMSKRLVGDGFYDSREMAFQNIIHSAAHIHNLCRDYDSISNSEKMPLYQLALLFGILPIPDEIKKNLDKLQEKANIESINDIIKKQLIKNYKTILYDDIVKLYESIVYELARISGETREEAQKIINTMESDIDTKRKMVKEQADNYNAIKKYDDTLNAAWESIKKKTDKRLAGILNKIDANNR